MQSTIGERPDGRNGDPLHVLIASDVRLYRDGLARILADQEGLTVAGTVAVALATDRAARLRPRVLLADAPAVVGGSLVPDVAAVSPDTLVVAFAVEDDGHHVVACAEAGAAAYVPRDASVQDLVEIVVGAAHDELVCSRRMAELAAEGGGARSEGPALTPREAEIGQLLAQGLSNKQIARRLAIQVATVKNHVHRVLEKLRVNGRGAAGARVRDDGAAAPRNGGAGT
jgi:DNA-binding NarL/FixJ family response regulator